MREPASMRKRRRNHLLLALGIAFSVAILGALLWRIDLGDFTDEFNEFNPLILPLAVIATAPMFYVRVLRWRYLLPSDSSPSKWRLFEALMIGFFATFVLPLRAGEFARAFALSKFEGIRFATGFASIVTERVFDVLSILCLLGLLLGHIESSPPWVRDASWALAGLSLGITAFVILCYVFSSTIKALFSRFIGLFFKEDSRIGSKLKNMFSDFVDGLRSISSVKELLVIIFLSFLLWGSTAFMYQFSMLLFGEFPSIWVGVAVTVMTALAVALPSAPGFLGPFQLGCVVALSSVFPYRESLALAYSLVVHSVQYIEIIAIGLFIMLLEGVRLSDFRVSETEDSKGIA